MRKSPAFLFIFLVLLLLVSGIAAAGFWQDITGWLSLSKIFKQKSPTHSVNIRATRDAIYITSDSYGKDINIIIGYNNYLVNEKGLKYYFRYEAGNLHAYALKLFEGEDYIIDSYPFEEGTIRGELGNKNLYTGPEYIIINSFNNTKINLTIGYSCFQQDEHEFCINVEHTGRFRKYEIGNYTSYIDSALSSSDELINSYVERKSRLNMQSIDFLKRELGFSPPIEKYVSFDSLVSDRIGYMFGFMVFNKHDREMTLADVEALSFGNTHEYVHMFFNKIPVTKNWFEEGLADYMEHKDQDRTNDFRCLENGWQEGYWEMTTGPSIGSSRSSRVSPFINITPLIPYSKFWRSPLPDATFLDPFNRHSYYKSAECFWVYINETYGSEAIKRIAMALHNTRRIIPPPRRQLWLITDIIKPVLGIDLSPLVQNRYELYYPLKSEYETCETGEECTTRNCVNIDRYTKECMACSSEHLCSRFDHCIDGVCKRNNNGKCYADINCISGFCKKTPVTAITGLCMDRPTLMAPAMSIRTMS